MGTAMGTSLWRTESVLLMEWKPKYSDPENKTDSVCAELYWGLFISRTELSKQCGDSSNFRSSTDKFTS